jgi:hypothetical protein
MNSRFCCSCAHTRFEAFRGDFVADEGEIVGLCFLGVCIVEGGVLVDIVFSAPEEVLGRVMVSRSNSAATFVQPNISTSR